MRRYETCALLALALVSLAGGAGAQSPVGTAFTYQGRLTDGGSPANGSYDLQFELFDATTGGSSVGGPLVSGGVSVVDGLFTVSLDFGASAFAGQARWLEIGVKPAGAPPPFTILGARQELTPSPNAVFSSTVPWTGIAGKPAGFADDIDDDSGGDITDVTAGTGLTGGGTSGAVTLNVDLAGSGTATTVSRSDHDHFSQAWSGSAANGLTITNAGGAALRGLSTATAGGTPGVYGEFSGTYGFGVHGNATSTAPGTFPVGVYGSSVHGYGIYGSASDGVGVTGFAYGTAGFTAGALGASQSPDGVGMYGQAYATSGFAIGVRGDTASPAGIAVWGYSTSTDSTGFPIGTEGRSDSPIGIGVNGFAAATSGANFGVRGASNSTAGTGVIGVAPATSGQTYGVFGEAFSSQGSGLYGRNTAPGGYGVVGGSGSTIGSGVGVRAVTNGPTGSGVFASAQGSTGQNYGVWGESSSNQGTGVFGLAASSSGFPNGVWGRTYGTVGNGVVGQAMASIGQAWGVLGATSSTEGVGVYGAANPTSGTGVGVWGRTRTAGGYGGYFENTSGGPAIGLSAGGIQFSDGTTQTTAGTGDITAVNTPSGGGLQGGVTAGAANLGLTTCGANQVLKMIGSAWTCAADQDSGGDITAVIAGTGLLGGATSGAATISLPTCAVGQVLKSTGAGWGCDVDYGPRATFGFAGSPVGPFVPVGAYVFMGPTVQVVTTASTPRLTGSAVVPLGTSGAPGSVVVRLGLCYQDAAGGSIFNFVGGNFMFVVPGSGLTTYSASATLVTSPATYNVGMCIMVDSGTVDQFDYVNGWVQVSN